MKLSLVHSSDPILRQVAEPVQLADNIGELVKAMYLLMITGNRFGIGLAAPQVGISKRLIVVHVEAAKFCVVNPVITRRWGGKIPWTEGCLSFPGLKTKTMRDRFITVEGLNENFKPMKRKCSGLVSACVQHEIDHLDGITINEQQNAPRPPSGVHG